MKIDLTKIKFTDTILAMLLIKVLIAPDMVTGIALVAAIANYCVCTYAYSKKELDELNNQSQRLYAEYQVANMTIAELQKQFSTVAKQSDETKKLLSATHVAQAFVPRAKRNQEMNT